MRRTASVLSIVLFVGLAVSVSAVEKTTTPRPRMEVAFVLDTTGSMGGLIEGAKAKIWSISNQLIAAKPRPDLRIALIAYRDRDDDYVTKLFDLSDDIDTVYARLQGFEAGGGGDTPESVNQALDEAVRKISWSADRGVYKAIFLVGDCPPHMDYPDDVKYPVTCQAAAKKDIVINTVQCGSQGDTTPIWREIANLAEGSYVAIPQTGGVQVVTTPMDEELGRWNAELGKTIVAYGDAKVQGEVRAKQAMAEAAPAPAAADRLAYNRATGKVVQGGGDLVDAVEGGSVKLADLKTDELPPEMRAMKPEEREAYLKEQAAKRAKIQARIDDLIAKRRAYIEEQQKKAGGGDAFDVEVQSIIRAQAGKKGVKYDSPAGGK